MKTATIDNLEVLLSEDKNKYFHLLIKETPTENLFKKNISEKKIINIHDKINFSTYLKEEKTIKNKYVTEALKKNKIDSFFITDNSSKKIENWAYEKKIKLITVPFKQQKRLENKVIFQKIIEKENLPAPKSQIIKNEKELKEIKNYPIVLQIAESHGGEGTFFINKKSEITKILKNEHLKYPLLCREYIEGQTLGATILISKNKLIFSTPRIQLYELNEEKRMIYMGIQWIKTSSLTKKAIKNINESLEKLGSTLQKERYRGIANVDFIIRKDEFFFIECNPRLSGSTPQLSMQKELLHGKNFIKEYTRSLEGKELTENLPFLPKTKYKGTTIDLDFLKNIKNKKIQMPKESGIFGFKNEKIKFISYKLEDAYKKNNILIYHTIKETQKIGKNESIGVIIMNEPLNKTFTRIIKKTFLK